MGGGVKKKKKKGVKTRTAKEREKQMRELPAGNPPQSLTVREALCISSK